MESGFPTASKPRSTGGLTASVRRVHCPLFWIQLMSNASWLTKEVWSHLNTKARLFRGHRHPWHPATRGDIQQSLISQQWAT